MSINIDVKTAKIGFWHLPKIFYALIFIEFWERFAFYGFQSVAVIYFIKKYNFSEAYSSDLFSSFSALLYALLVIGGVIGDKILGIRRTYLVGILTFIIGYGLLSIANTQQMLYFAMGVILVGNIFFKTNANNYVGRCFERNDPRLDSAFTYFYMSINLGSIFSIFFVPIISKAYGYHYGLGLSCIGMLFGLVFFIIFNEKFRLSDNQEGKNPKHKIMLSTVFLVLGLIVAYVVGIILKHNDLSRLLMIVGGISFATIYLLIAFRLPKYEMKGMLIAFILLIQSIIFWIIYIQTVTTFVLFAHHNINLNILGYNLPAGVTQVFNPLYIVMFSPILANIYLRFHNRGKDVGIAYKFSTGIFVTSLCFFILAGASTFLTNSAYQISILWLFIAYGFYSLGEMLVSALGPSMVAKLLPKRLGGFAQGIWYLTAAVGMKIGGIISSYTASEYGGVDNQVDIAFKSLVVYNHLFYALGGIVLVISIGFFFISKSITKSINEVLEHRS